MYLAYVKMSEIGQLNPQTGEPLAHYFHVENDNGEWVKSWSDQEWQASPLPWEYWMQEQGGELPCDEQKEFSSTKTFDVWNTDPEADTETSYDCNLENVDLAPEDCWPSSFLKDAVEGNTFSLRSIKILPTNANVNDIPRMIMLETRLTNAEATYQDLLKGDEPTKGTFRVLSLAHPEDLGISVQKIGDDFGESSAPDGYGPYIMDRFTSYNSTTKRLTLWHTISSWNDGGPAVGPYGVYTRESVLSLPSN